MKKLLIAAGGGGDAFTAGILAEAMDCETVIASFSWDRIIYDPAPGPRCNSEFDNVSIYGKYNTIISGISKLKKEDSKAFLPMIASYFKRNYFLIELNAGVSYLHNQLKEIIDLENVDEVVIIDVGGDILATGKERRLKSPIADASVLAACNGLDVPVTVSVAGCGLDGELNEYELLDILKNIQVENKTYLSKDLANKHLQAFEWLPSEASALFFMASIGKRGICEIRQDGYCVELNDFSATIFQLEFKKVFSNSLIAKKLLNTDSLLMIENIVRKITSISELDIERNKRINMDNWNESRTNEELVEELLRISHNKSIMGIDYMTQRRLCEVLKIKGKARESFIDYLKYGYSDFLCFPLWKCI